MPLNRYHKLIIISEILRRLKNGALASSLVIVIITLSACDFNITFYPSGSQLFSNISQFIVSSVDVIVYGVVRDQSMF